jgi:putative acetyltransferase
MDALLDDAARKQAVIGYSYDELRGAVLCHAPALVAEADGRILGHIAFLPMTISGGAPGWYGHGPVSVAPAYHRQGIGSTLIRAGLARLLALGERGCCLVGHLAYYGRFGFQHSPELGVAGVPEAAFFALAFTGQLPCGTVAFHAAFDLDVPPPCI